MHGGRKSLLYGSTNLDDLGEDGREPRLLQIFNFDSKNSPASIRHRMREALYHSTRETVNTKYELPMEFQLVCVPEFRDRVLLLKLAGPAYYGRRNPSKIRNIH
jgi:hypothetical protein